MDGYDKLQGSGYLWKTERGIWKVLKKKRGIAPSDFFFLIIT